MAGELIYSATDTGSRRSLMVVNEGDSVWSYLTAPGSMSPVADCWLLNLVEAPIDLSEYRAAANVPPATIRVTSQPGALLAPATDEISVAWSEYGDAIAVSVRACVVAYLTADEPHGYCRFLTVASAFGNPFDADRFNKLFGVRGG